MNRIPVRYLEGLTNPEQDEELESLTLDPVGTLKQQLALFPKRRDSRTSFHTFKRGRWLDAWVSF